MRHAGFLVLALAASCVASMPETGLSEGEQAEWDGGPDDPEGETVVIEGTVDGWDAGWWFPSPGNPVDPGDTGDDYGGGGGTGPGGGPGDQPERKKCSRDQGLDQCLDCCFYNHDKVDGWVCRKITGDSKRQRAKREKCWKDAVKEQSRCQVEDCGRDRPIITTTTGELL